MIERLKLLLLEGLSYEAKQLLQYRRTGKKLTKRQMELEPEALKGDSKARAELGALLRAKSGNKKGQATVKHNLIAKLHREGSRTLQAQKRKK